MAREVIVDLRGAPPAQGGGGSAKIPEGRYPFRVEKGDTDVTQAGKSRITIWLRVAGGEFKGKRIRDDFIFPKSPDDSKFGAQRFHAFLLAAGAPAKEARFKVDLDWFTNRPIFADIEDNEMPASPDGKYAARITSRRGAYYSVQQIKEEQEKQKQNGNESSAAASPPAPAAPAAPIPPSGAVLLQQEPDVMDVPDDLEDPMAAAYGGVEEPAASPPASTAPPSPSATVEDELDELFK